MGTVTGKVAGAPGDGVTLRPWVLLRECWAGALGWWPPPRVCLQVEPGWQRCRGHDWLSPLGGALAGGAVPPLRAVGRTHRAGDLGV